MPRRVVVLISGTGTNLQALLDHDTPHYAVVGVLSNRAARGLAFASAAGIEGMVVKPRRGEPRETYDARLAEALAPLAADIVVLAGFMRILSARFVTAFAGRLLNIHPSLLPKYRGLDVHQRVLAAGDSRSGASVHFVTPTLDAGPVLLQGEVPVVDGDDEDTLSARVHRAEHRIYPAAVDLAASGRALCTDDGISLDGRRLEAPLVARFDADGELTAWPDTLSR